MKKIVLPVIVLFYTCGIIAQVKLGGAVADPAKSIFENLSKSGDHTVFTAGIRAGGLADTLQYNGPFTLFAPVSNAIIHEIPAGHVAYMFNELRPEQQPAMKKIIAYHLIRGRLLQADILRLIRQGNGSAKLITANGEALTAKADTGNHIIMVDANGRSSVIIQPDIEQKNGIIHNVSEALLPAGVLDDWKK